MCCFLVPMAQAVATTVYRKLNEKSINGPAANFLKCKVPALEKMLWGGTVMLIVDHILNGELTWRAPFFTALEQADGVNVMLHELLAVGFPMSLVLTLIWGAYALLNRTPSLSTGKK